MTGMTNTNTTGHDSMTEYVLSDAVMKQPIYGSKTVLTYVPAFQVDVSGGCAELIVYYIQATRAD